MSLFAKSFALAATALLAALSPAPAQAQSDWRCDIILCLANPQGWKSVPYCVPPVRQLIRHLSRPKAKWPVCPYLPNHRMKAVFDGMYEHCPAGYIHQQKAGLGTSALYIIAPPNSTRRSLNTLVNTQLVASGMFCVKADTGTQYLDCARKHVSVSEFVPLVTVPVSYMDVEYAGTAQAPAPTTVRLYTSPTEPYDLQSIPLDPSTIVKGSVAAVACPQLDFSTANNGNSADTR